MVNHWQDQRLDILHCASLVAQRIQMHHTLILKEDLGLRQIIEVDPLKYQIHLNP